MQACMSQLSSEKSAACPFCSLGLLVRKIAEPRAEDLIKALSDKVNQIAAQHSVADMYKAQGVPT